MDSKEAREWLSPEIPEDVRLKIAQGHCSMDGAELFHALIALLSDIDPEIREESTKSIKRLWERVSPFFSYLSAKEVHCLEDTFSNEPEMVEAIKRIRMHHHQRGHVEEVPAIRRLPSKEFFEEREVLTEDERGSIYKKILEMSVIEKIKIALMGNKEIRSLLIRDSNKLVATTVLKNPRLTEDEVVRFVQSKNVCDDVLRIIANSREWTKNYHVKLSLVNNPKTPISLSLKFLTHILEKDLQHLAKNRNIPIAVSTTARKMVMQKDRH